MAYAMESCSLTAFSPETVADHLQGATCLETWEEHIFVGVSDGSLCTLSKTVEAGSPVVDGHWRVQAKRALAKRSVLQLAVSVTRNMLLCLADDGVNAFALPMLMLKGQAGRTRGATVFSWDDAGGLLCTVVKRRLLIFHYDGLEFVEQREVSLAEVATSVQSVGGTVYVALQTSFVAVDASTGATTHICTSKMPIAALRRSGSDEILLTCDQQTVFMGEQSKRLRRGWRITWSAAPLAVSVCPPYILGLFPESIEVRLVDPFTDSSLHQRIALPDIIAMAAHSTTDGSFFLLSKTGSIVCLAPVPYKAQAQKLLSLKEHEEALAMCRLMPAGEEGARRLLEDEIQLGYGRHLLQAHKFEEAMLAFSMSGAATPADVLRSFPFLVPHRLLQSLPARRTGQDSDSLDDLDAEERVRAVATLTPYLLSYRSRMAAAAPTRTSTGGRLGEVVPASTVGGPAAPSDPAAILIDTALLHALLMMPDSGALLRFLQRPNSIDAAAGEAALKQAGRYAELVSLYQNNQQHESALDLLQTLSTAPETLAVAPQGAAVELKGPAGTWAAIKYLTQMESPDFKLISTNAKWILHGDPEAGLEMFTQIRPPLSASVVLPILTSYTSAEVAESYLESALESGAAERDIYEQELAMLYLQRLLRCSGPTLPQELPCYERLKHLVLSSRHLDCAALLRLLPTHTLLELRAVLLERLDRHVEALRICVHRLGQLRLAEAYCDRVYSRRQAATRQCQAPLLAGFALVASSDLGTQTGGNEDIYMMLIQVLLEEPDDSGSYRLVQRAPDDETWKEVTCLLSRKHQAVHPLQALELLPGELPMQNCLQFLESALRGASEQRRRAAIAKNLRRAEQVIALSHLATAQHRTVTISSERACRICHKRLQVGAAAAVAFPDGMLAHFSCHRRSENGT